MPRLRTALCVLRVTWSSAQDFFATFLEKFDRVLAAVAVLTLPKELVTVGITCRAHIASELQKLSEAFIAGNFPPRGSARDCEAGFDRINSAVASLDAFGLVCSAENPLKMDAARLFDEAKTTMKAR